MNLLKLTKDMQLEGHTPIFITVYYIKKIKGANETLRKITQKLIHVSLI